MCSGLWGEEASGRAELKQFATWAIGLTGGATAAAVPDEPVTEEGPVFAGHLGEEVLFDLFGLGAGGQAETEREARHVGVNDDTFVEVEGIAEDDVGGFASDAVELDEVLHGVGDLAVVTFDEFLAGALDVFGLMTKEAESADVLFELGQAGGGVVGGGTVFVEEERCDQVDLFVVGLRGQDGGDEKFERVGVMEFAVGVRIGFSESIDDQGEAFASGQFGFARHKLES